MEALVPTWLSSNSVSTPAAPQPRQKVALDF